MTNILNTVLWSGITIACYLVAKQIHRRWPKPWLMPLAVTPALLIVALISLQVSYRDYASATNWLVAFMGPATVAFAVPIYEHGRLIRRHWPVLLTGMVVGSAVSMASSFALAMLLGLNQDMRISLLPRSISTPFALVVSADIGGVPELTALFVVLTGILGAIIGQLLIGRLPLKTSLARGALFGVGAHAAGTATAHAVGATEGAVSGLVMILAGLLNVIAAPLVTLIIS